MDLVIPYTRDLEDGLELRFSLRSYDKYLTGFNRVFLIGHKPSWISNIEYIPAKDHQRGRSFSIYSKLLIACTNPRISENFIYATDDVYLLRPLMVGDFKYWYNGTLQEAITDARSGYKELIRNTLDIVPGGLNFDIHAPVIINKKSFISANAGAWDKDRLVKSIYCNKVGGNTEFLEDRKLRKREDVRGINETKDILFLSTGDYSLQIGGTEVLNGLFHLPSRFEPPRV